MEVTTFKLADETIAQIAKLLQVAILTSTDIVDNIRQLELRDEEGFLFMTDEYLENFETNIERMVEQVKDNHDGQA